MNWEICKEFEFDYGHRVWNQQLNQQLSIDNKLVCRHKHGHRGKVEIYLGADKLNGGMVSDFKHLNWLKMFLDETVDHKFIVDINDPGFSMIACGTINENLKSFDTFDGIQCLLNNIFVPGTDHVVGKVIDVSQLYNAYPKEILEGIFIVDFVPTSENLSKWLFDLVNSKLKLFGIRTTKVVWWETPKSRSIYSG